MSWERDPLWSKARLYFGRHRPTRSNARTPTARALTAAFAN